MQVQMRFGTKLALFAGVIGLLVGNINVSAVEGPNPNFDALIAELQARSASYTNVEDKAEVKTKKKVDKVIASFYKKPSVALDKDLKLAAKVSKQLTKLFPDEFAPTMTVTERQVSAAIVPDNLANLIQDALVAFGGNIESILADAQDMVDAAIPGKCKDKAQAILDEVTTQLDLANSSPDLPAAAKIMSKAAKTVLKGQSAAEAALECVPHFGGDEWYMWTLGMSIDGEPISFYEDVRVSGPDSLILNYFATGNMSFYGMTEDGSATLELYFTPGNPGMADTFDLYGTLYLGLDSYSITEGYVTIAKFPKSLPERLTATFYFTATGSAGTVDVSSGVLSIWLYPPF